MGRFTGMPYLFIIVLLLCGQALSREANQRTKQGAIPQDVSSGYFPGRSGQIVIKDNSDVLPKDLQAIFIDESGHYLKTEGSSSNSISATNVMDVVARSLGVQPLNSEFSSRDLKPHMFENARANALFSLESVGSDLVKKYGLANLQQLGESATSLTLPVSYPAYPYQSISVAASIATGSLPFEHGVVASSWPKGSSKTWAYVSQGRDAAPAKANLADVLQQSFLGQSLILSASSNPQHSFAFCPNYILMAAHPEWNFLCFALDPKNQDFEPMGTRSVSQSKQELEEALHITNEKLRADLADPRLSVLNALTGGVSASVKGNQVTVNFPATWESAPTSATFDISEPSEWILFAELQYAFSIAGRLGVVGPLHSLVDDDAPDSFAFTFASVTTLIEKFGRESNEVAGGLHLIDAIIPKIISSFQTLYPDRILVEVVLLGSHVSGLETKDNRDVLAEVKKSLPELTNVQDYFPNIYLNAVPRLGQVCEGLRLELSGLDYSVHCPAIEPEFAFNPRFATFAASGTAVNVTQAEIEEYQIELWVSIGGSFIVLWAVYVIANMGFHRSVTLYGTFNPKIDDNKRR